MVSCTSWDWEVVLETRIFAKVGGTPGSPVPDQALRYPAFLPAVNPATPACSSTYEPPRTRLVSRCLPHAPSSQAAPSVDRRATTVARRPTSPLARALSPLSCSGWVRSFRWDLAFSFLPPPPLRGPPPGQPAGRPARRGVFFVWGAALRRGFAGWRVTARAARPGGGRAREGTAPVSSTR